MLRCKQTASKTTVVYVHVRAWPSEQLYCNCDWENQVRAGRREGGGGGGSCGMTGVRGVRFPKMGITPKGKSKELQANRKEWGESFSFCC